LRARRAKLTISLTLARSRFLHRESDCWRVTSTVCVVCDGGRTACKVLDIYSRFRGPSRVAFPRDFFIFSRAFRSLFALFRLFAALHARSPNYEKLFLLTCVLERQSSFFSD